MAIVNGSTVTPSAPASFLELGGVKLETSTMNNTVFLEETDTENDNVFSGSGKDVIVGNSLGNILEGGAGNDFIAGLGGNDTIRGGAGVDKITGGADSGQFGIGFNNSVSQSDAGDRLYGGEGVDLFKYNKKGSLNDGADYIFDFEDNVDKLVLYGQYTIDNVTAYTLQNIDTAEQSIEFIDSTFINFGNGKGIVVEGVTAEDIADDIIDLTPAPAVNTIDGDAGNNYLTGTANDDVINGFAGRDIITGGMGNDTINGGSGKDYLAGQEGNDIINGGDGFDTLIGGADTGTVVIDGSGNAMLSGGGDILTGGADLDVFKYTARGMANEGADLVTDFTTGLDKLLLEGAYSLVDVTNGTFVKFAEGAGVIVENVNSADLAADIIVA